MSHLLQILLLLAIVIGAAKIAGALAMRIGQPAVFGEILVGLLLGPTVVDVLGWGIFASHGEAGRLLSLMRDLAEIGVLLLMFVAGLETDLDQMRKIGGVAFWSALGGVVLPMVGGIALAAAFGLPVMWEGIFIGTILTATSVSITAQTLMELGALRTREGATILGAAVIDDVMGIIVLSVVVGFARAASTGGVDLLASGWIFVRIMAFFAVGVLAGRWIAGFLRWTVGLGVNQGLMAGVLFVALVYAWAAEFFGGVAAITGAYLAGVLVARTPFHRKVEEGIQPLSYSLFVPVFFVSIGLQANGRDVGERAAFAIALVVIAIVAKILGAGAAARLSGFSTKEATRVGVGMVSRGEVGLIVAGYGLANGIIGPPVFSSAVLMVLVTTMVTPPLLRLTFGRGPAAPASSPGEVEHAAEHALPAA